jgi:hypothetical protein
MDNIMDRYNMTIDPYMGFFAQFNLCKYSTIAPHNPPIKRRQGKGKKSVGS